MTSIRNGLKTPSYSEHNTHETPAQAYKRLVEDLSANAESNNGYHIDRVGYSYNGIDYSATSYDPHHLRTYTAEVIKPDGSMRLSKVVYPKIAFIHGLACCGAYFEDQAKSVAKLGIRSKAIDLPAIPYLRDKPEELWQWQVGAVINMFDSMSSDGNDVVLIGHSRGAQLATYAARDIVQSGNKHLAGLMLQGPAIAEAIRVKTIKSGLGKSAFVGINSLRHHPGRGSSLMLDIARVVLSRIEQTKTEARQAMSYSIRDIIMQELKAIPIDIEYARGDEFTEDMYNFVINLLEEASAQDERIKPLTVIDRSNTNHMLSAPASIRSDIATLSDPRMSSGHILAFLQSAVDLYSPPVIRYNDDSGNYESYRYPVQEVS